MYSEANILLNFLSPYDFLVILWTLFSLLMNTTITYE